MCSVLVSFGTSIQTNLFGGVYSESFRTNLFGPLCQTVDLTPDLDLNWGLSLASLLKSIKMSWFLQYLSNLSLRVQYLALVGWWLFQADFPTKYNPRCKAVPSQMCFLVLGWLVVLSGLFRIIHYLFLYSFISMIIEISLSYIPLSIW